MKRWSTPWLLGVSLAMVALLDGPGRASAHRPAQEPGSPAPRIIAQWQQAGAEFGWITIDPRGDWRFHREKPATGGLPAFRFSRFPAGKVRTLAAPDVPFGLWLGSSTKDAHLEELAGLEPLQALNIEGNYAYGVTDAGLKTLAPLSQLQTLRLPHTALTDGGMKALTRLKALRTLTILSSGGGVSDAGLNELGRLIQLRSLSLRHTKLKDEHLKVLGGLKQLRRLELSFANVTDAGLEELPGLSQLQSLRLFCTKVTDAGLKHLAGLNQLETLDLYGTRVTGTGLKELAHLEHLQALELQGAQKPGPGRTSRCSRPGPQVAFPGRVRFGALHLKWLLDELEPHADTIRSLDIDDLRIDVFCFSSGATSSPPAIPRSLNAYMHADRIPGRKYRRRPVIGNVRRTTGVTVHGIPSLFAQTSSYMDVPCRTAVRSR